MHMIEKEKKIFFFFLFARLCVKPEFSDRELMKNKEKIHASFSVALQTAKFTALARDKLLMKVEKL